MHYTAFDTKDGSDKIIYIKRSYSVKGVKKQEIVEKYDSANQLTKEHGDWVKFIKNRVIELQNERKEKKIKNKSITVDYSLPISAIGNYNSFNFGYLLLQKVYYELRLDQFFYHLKNNNKLRIKYSLNDVMKFLVFTRVIIPGSKLDNMNHINYFAENFDITLDDVYDALDRFDDCKDKLQKYLYNKARFLLPPSDKVIYYDVTNFYYEIESENEIAAYGVEKKLLPDPITSFGLFMDSNGIPIRYSDYCGSINESKQMLPEWMNLENDLTNNSYIVCADAGMNSAKIKHHLITKKNHYIFSQSVKKFNNAMQNEMFEEKGWIPLNDHKRYKIKKLLKDSIIEMDLPDGTKKKVKVEIDTMYIMTFDEERRKYILNKIEEREEKAKAIIAHPGNYDNISTSDGKQYVKKIVFDKNGEIIVGQSLLLLDTEKIEKEKKFAGYGAIVTDLFETDIKEILRISTGRWEIEDCFRQMKSGFSTRPIYVRTVKHIHAHFLTCFVALTITKLLERKYLKNLSAEQIFNILRNTTFIKIDDGDYLAGNISKDALSAYKILGFDSLLFNWISNNTLNEIISYSKKTTQQFDKQNA